MTGLCDFCYHDLISNVGAGLCASPPGDIQSGIISSREPEKRSQVITQITSIPRVDTWVYPYFFLLIERFPDHCWQTNSATDHSNLFRVFRGSKTG